MSTQSAPQTTGTRSAVGVRTLAVLAFGIAVSGILPTSLSAMLGEYTDASTWLNSLVLPTALAFVITTKTAVNETDRQAADLPRRKE